MSLFKTKPKPNKKPQYEVQYLVHLGKAIKYSDLNVSNNDCNIIRECGIIINGVSREKINPELTCVPVKICGKTDDILDGKIDWCRFGSPIKEDVAHRNIIRWIPMNIFAGPSEGDDEMLYISYPNFTLAGKVLYAETPMEKAIFDYIVLPSEVRSGPVPENDDYEKLLKDASMFDVPRLKEDLMARENENGNGNGPVFVQDDANANAAGQQNPRVETIDPAKEEKKAADRILNDYDRLRKEEAKRIACKAKLKKWGLAIGGGALAIGATVLGISLWKRGYKNDETSSDAEMASLEAPEEKFDTIDTVLTVDEPVSSSKKK